jgi:hypothetical protein
VISEEERQRLIVRHQQLLMETDISQSGGPQ